MTAENLSPLRRLVERVSANRPVARGERCDLCALEIPSEHRHVYDEQEGAVLCACGICTLLFRDETSGSGRYRLVPDGCVALDLRLDRLDWRALDIPVDLAFFVRARGGETVAYYPSPAGAVRSLLSLDALQDVARRDPAFEPPPAPQALLVDARGQKLQAWIVGIDACYRLVAIFRTRWEGLQGGEALRAEVARFFDDLRTSARREGETTR